MADLFKAASEYCLAGAGLLAVLALALLCLLALEPRERKGHGQDPS